MPTAKGRVREVVKAPTATVEDADVVLTGPAGNDDLVRMLPVRVGRSQRGHGAVSALLRNRYCDYPLNTPTPSVSRATKSPGL